MWENTIAIHSVLKKKTTKLNSQSAQYKKKSTKTILEKNKNNHKKNHVGKHCNNPPCFKKNYKAKFSISLILKK
jgi:uncharacterized protein YaiI (UPF0178 family)